MTRRIKLIRTRNTYFYVSETLFRIADSMEIFGGSCRNQNTFSKIDLFSKILGIYTVRYVTCNYFKFNVDFFVSQFIFYSLQ